MKGQTEMRTRILALMVAVPALAAAGYASTLNFHDGSRVWVEGTSTARGWRCEAATLQGNAQAPSFRISELANGTHRGDMTIAVAELDCRNGTMNGHMRRALQTEQHPNIRFRATSVQVTPAADGTAAVRMGGQLSIAGQEKAVTLTGTGVEENGGLRVRGTTGFDMTEYGVRPPSLMAGTMRVRGPVTVGFDVLLKP
jgi:polyisoprenoid-binding protein YceI